MKTEEAIIVENIKIQRKQVTVLNSEATFLELQMVLKLLEDLSINKEYKDNRL